MRRTLTLAPFGQSHDSPEDDHLSHRARLPYQTGIASRVTRRSPSRAPGVSSQFGTRPAEIDSHRCVTTDQTGPMTTLDEIWPPFGLRIGCGPLELRVPRDEDIAVLVDLAQSGVHGDVMPFSVAWTLAPAGQLPANYARFIWQQRAEQVDGRLGLELVVRHEGQVVGMQGLSGDRYPARHTAETGSWLGQRFHGLGIGTLMRQAICAFAFDHLDAEWITSGAFVDNPASNAVSRKVGYQPNGTVREFRGDEWQVQQRFLLTRQTLVPPPHPLEVEGVDAYRRFAGLD